jgi:predicted small lipoprotein YifL
VATKDTRFQLTATAVCGYKGYQISDFSVYTYLITTAVCGYKGYQISVYLIATAVCGYKGYAISALLVYSGLWLYKRMDLGVPYNHGDLRL